MRKIALALILLVLGCLSSAPAETAKEQKYVFYFKNTGGEGTVNIDAAGNIAGVAIDGGTLLRFNRDSGDLTSYRSKTKTGYMELQFTNNSVTTFEQGYASGKATYYYGKNGTHVVYFSQDRTTEADLNFTPRQDALAGTLLETAHAYRAFFQRPDQRYRTGNRIVSDFECDTYEITTDAGRREVCYSEKTGSIILDITYSRLDSTETETTRAELRSYLEGGG